MKDNNHVLNIVNDKHFELSEYLDDLKNTFYEVIKVLDIKEDLELSLVFVDAETQVNLNKTYRNKDYVADVLTFFLEEDNKFDTYKLTHVRELGDIFVCYEKAVEQAKKYEHSLRRELCFLFVHGFLHILGYDHIKPEDEKVMFDLQRVILNNLQIFRTNRVK